MVLQIRRIVGSTLYSISITYLVRRYLQQIIREKFGDHHDLLSLPYVLLTDSTTRSKVPNLHRRFPSPLAHNGTHVPPIRHFPHAIAPLVQLPYIISGLDLKQPHPPIIPASDEEPRVELQRRHRRVMCRNPVKGSECREAEYDYASV